MHEQRFYRVAGDQYKEHTMVTFLLFLLVIALLDLGAMRWGINSTDDINSREWDRRRARGYSML